MMPVDDQQQQHEDGRMKEEYPSTHSYEDYHSPHQQFSQQHYFHNVPGSPSSTEHKFHNDTNMTEEMQDDHSADGRGSSVSLDSVEASPIQQRPHLTLDTTVGLSQYHQPQGQGRPLYQPVWNGNGNGGNESGNGMSEYAFSPQQQLRQPQPHRVFQMSQPYQPFSHQQQLHTAPPMQFPPLHHDTYPAGFNPNARRRSLSAPPVGMPLRQFEQGEDAEFAESPSSSVGELRLASGLGEFESEHRNVMQHQQQPVFHIPPSLTENTTLPTPPHTPLLRSPMPHHQPYQNQIPLPPVATLQRDANIYPPPQQHYTSTYPQPQLPPPQHQMHPRIHHLIYDHTPTEHDHPNSPRYPSPPPRPASAPIFHVSDMTTNLPYATPQYGSHSPMEPHFPTGPYYPHDHPYLPPPRRLYKCPKPFCTKIYKNANGLKYHLDRGICEYDTTSPVPPNSSSNPLDLEAAAAGHVKIAHRPYWCKVPGCGKKYKNLNGLKYHAKAVHPGMNFREEVKGVFVGI